MYKRLTQALLLLVLIMPSATTANATELVISGNGDGSNSEVNLSQNQTQNVTQNNQSEINNTVDANANTGDNQVNNNTGGENSIETGDIDLDVNAQNSANHNQVTNSCCQSGDINASITGNGTDSQNSIILSQTIGNGQRSGITSTQTATINNQINLTANTGGNQANHNNGTASITTGTVTADVNLKNGVNSSHILASQNGSHSLVATINGNGSGSENHIAAAFFFDTNILDIKVADVLNQVVFEANTGNNQANGNNGAISILTGDIKLALNIQNDPINTSHTTVDLCCDDDDPTDDDDSDPTTPPSNGNGNVTGVSGSGSSSSGSSNGNGQVLGASDMLPVTGGFGFLFALLANILMFLLGCYLRLRSGRSPALSA